MQPKSRQTNKSGSHQGRDHGNHNNTIIQGPRGQINQMSLSNSPQKDMRQNTGKNFNTQASIKSSNMSHLISQGMQAGPHDTLIHQSMNQQRAQIGNVPLTVSIHPKNSSQKRQKQQAAQNVASMHGMNTQQQQIQLVNKNQYVSVKNANFTRINHPVVDQNQYHTQNQINQMQGPNDQIYDYMQHQQAPPGKQSSTSLMSPQPATHYYQKMGSLEQNSQIRSQKQTMIQQPPHFIKVKSKTNNPTRQSSPGIKGAHWQANNDQKMASGHFATRVPRESNYSNPHTQMKRDMDGISSTGHNPKIEVDTDTPVKINFHGVNTMPYMGKAQLMSQQNSPKKGDPNQMLDRTGVNQIYANSMIEQNDENVKQTLKNNLITDDKMQKKHSPAIGKNAIGFIDIDPNSQLSASGTSHSLYQKGQKAKNIGLVNNNVGMKQSVDIRLQNFQKLQSKIIKGQSSKDILNQKQQTQQTQSSIQTNQRLHSSGMNGSNDQLGGKSIERQSFIGNSPGGPVISNKGNGGNAGVMTNNNAALNGLKQHHSTTQSAKANKLSHIGQISLDQNPQKQMDHAQQQKKYLNMVVQKKIGGIASGKQRREHRNQMIKSNQQYVFNENKSAVGSIGSIGSLGPFMGVQEIGYQGHGAETYDPSMSANPQNMTMKFPIDTEKVNKTNGHQKFQHYQKYSQLQQLHQNNVNPMNYTMTEHFAANQSKVGQYQQLVNFSQDEQFRTEQHMKTQGSNLQSVTTNQLDNSINRSIKQNKQNALYRPNDQNFRTQTNANYENQSLLGSGSSQAKQQIQTGNKAQVIQMRKINPISKTAHNESKNASIDMKKSSNNSMGMHNRIVSTGNALASQTQQNMTYVSKNQQQQNQKNVYNPVNYGHQVQPPKIMGHQNEFEQNLYSKTSNQKYGSQKGQKAYSNTTKVSLNNTPKGTKKMMISQGMNAATAGRANNSSVPMQYLGHGANQLTNNNNQKPQQLLKQQPIGQPMGDIPVKNDNKQESNMKQQQQFQVNEFNVDDNIELRKSQVVGQTKKHHYTQSMLIDEQKLQNQNQTVGGQHPFSKSIIQQVVSPQVNIVQTQEFDQNTKQKIANKPQSNSSMGGKTTQLALNKSSGIVHGKVKLRVVSENSSPPAEVGALFHNSTQGGTFNQTHNFHTQNYNKSGQKSHYVSTQGSNNRSIGKNNQVNQSQFKSNAYDKRQNKASMQSTGHNSKSSAHGGSNMAVGVMGPFNSPPNAMASSANRKSLYTNESNNLRRSSAAPSSSSNTLKNSTRAGTKTVGASADPGKKSFQNNKSTSKNKNEMGNQQINQYFKQKKNMVGQVVQVQGTDSTHTQGHQRQVDGNQQVFAFAKLSHIDSPKDGSIERARQNDMLQFESGRDSNQVNQMNQQLKNVITIDLPEFKGNQAKDGGLGQTIQRNKEQEANCNQQYILKNIEKHLKNPQALSPRSKEVYLIRQLITDCFRKYEKPPKTQLELYKIGKMLGKGAFGKVNLGLHRLTRKLCAIKSINMDFMKEESQKKKIMNEINILKSLRHPNNIKILETFQTEKHHMIVMELCPGGDLLNYVRKRRKLSEKYAKFVFKQIMEGIAYLHENKVAHRDIKLDNILLDGHGNIKIGDFGVSRKIEEKEILFEQCGTPAYIAPEIVQDMGYKGFPVDIWSAGICLFAMLYGNVPFKANQIGDLNTVEQLNQDIEYKDTVSKEAISVMKMMLQKKPNQRAIAEEILMHPWLNDNIDEHIDIFDEQELQLIRKEFTYVLQKKKLRDFQEQKEKLKQLALQTHNQSNDSLTQQASRRPDDLNTEFTECSIQTHENSLMKNDSSRSVILCPFNTQTGDKTAAKIIQMSEGLMEDKDVMIRFHPRVRELDRNYEKLNNQDFDNGVYHKYAYKQKGKQQDGDKDGKGNKDEKGLKEETIQQSDVQVNNLVSTKEQREQQAASGATSGTISNAETARKRRKELAEQSYQNHYIRINQQVINDTAKLGFPRVYIEKCLRENSNNHCTTTYYLLCMDQNF